MTPTPLRSRSVTRGDSIGTVAAAGIAVRNTGALVVMSSHRLGVVVRKGNHSTGEQVASHAGREFGAGLTATDQFVVAIPVTEARQRACLSIERAKQFAHEITVMELKRFGFLTEIRYSLASNRLGRTRRGKRPNSSRKPKLRQLLPLKKLARKRRTRRRRRIQRNSRPKRRTFLSRQWHEASHR